MEVPGGALAPAAATENISGNKRHTRLKKTFFNGQLQEREQMYAECAH